MKKRYVRQGGSALVYALVAVVLVVVLAGGLYWARQYNVPTEVARNDNPNTSEQEKKPASQPVNDKSSDKTPAKSSDAEQKSEQKEQASPQAGSQMLPTTGPVLNMTEPLAVTALTFALASYFTSRRAHWTFRDK